jgi:hypothetical protein
MIDDVKCATHLLDGETIYCGMDVVDTIESCGSNGGIAIVYQGEKVHYGVVRYVTDIKLCNCPDCIAKVIEFILPPQELGVMAQALMDIGTNCPNDFIRGLSDE